MTPEVLTRLREAAGIPDAPGHKTALAAFITTAIRRADPKAGVVASSRLSPTAHVPVATVERWHAVIVEAIAAGLAPAPLKLPGSAVSDLAAKLGIDPWAGAWQDRLAKVVGVSRQVVNHAFLRGIAPRTLARWRRKAGGTP